MKWNEVAIRKLCLPTRQRDPREMPSEEFAYVDISSIDRDSKAISQVSRILGSEAPSRARKEIRTGDIIISSVRPNLNAVAIVPPELNGQIASTGFCVLRPDSERVIGKYLFYYSRTSDFIEALCAKVRGAHYPAVSDKDVTGEKIPLPPMSEQRRIVEILDQADALRKKRAEADAKAVRILPSLFYKMFGDPAMNQRNWEVVLMDNILADTRNGLYKHGDFYGRGTQILKMFNIKTGELNLSRMDRVELTNDEMERYELKPGDILLNRVNTKELVGKCAVITDVVGPAVFESKNIRVRLKPDKATPEYVAHYLNTTFGHAALCQGVKHAIGMATINNTDLRRMMISKPPVELQRLWDIRVHEIRFNQKLRQEVFVKLDQLFSILLYRALTGSLTADWRKAHMKELFQEMEQQAKQLNLKGYKA